MDKDSIEPEDDSEEMQALLRKEYCAPQLDGRFTAKLVARMQSVAALRTNPSSPRSSMQAICLYTAAVAMSVIAIVWISHLSAPKINQDLAHRSESESARSESLVENFTAIESKENNKSDEMSVFSRTQNDRAINESEPTNNNQNIEKTREFKIIEESLLSENRKPSTKLSILESEIQTPAQSKPTVDGFKRQQNITAMTEHGDKLYLVKNGRLYEADLSDGSHRMVGKGDWQKTAAMGSAGEHIYIVNDDQLFEVNPETGAQRFLGKPVWAGTGAITSLAGKLYITCKGRLYQVSLEDGSRKQIHDKKEQTYRADQSKQ